MPAVLAAALALATAPIDVAGTPISRERLEHWQRVSAAATGHPRRWRRERHRHEAAQLLITDVWLRKEARARGLYAPRAVIVREFRVQTRQSFTSPEAFRRFLRNTGQTRADIILQMRIDEHSLRIRRQVIEGAETAPEQRARLEAYADEHYARWREQTTCSPRYHVAAQCRDVTRPAPGR